MASLNTEIPHRPELHGESSYQNISRSYLHQDETASPIFFTIKI